MRSEWAETIRHVHIEPTWQPKPASRRRTLADAYAVASEYHASRTTRSTVSEVGSRPTYGTEGRGSGSSAVRSARGRDPCTSPDRETGSWARPSPARVSPAASSRAACRGMAEGRCQGPNAPMPCTTPFGSECASLGDQRAEEGVFALQADGVEVADDAAVGRPEVGLCVRDTFGGAVGGHEGFDLPQVWSGDGREQMVFDLVVQAAHEHRHQRSAADVAAHQHLAAQEVELELWRHERHANVVGREREAHVEAEHRQLDGQEGEGHAGRQHDEDQGEQPAEPYGQEGHLDPAALDLAAAEHPLDAVPVQRH